MITIKQYKEFSKLDSGKTENEQILDLAKVFQFKVDNMTNDEVKKKLSELVGQMVLSQKKHSHIKLNGTWYKVDNDLVKLKFSQWIYFDSIMLNVNDNNVYEYIEKLISIFLRPCRFYKWFPKKFDINKTDEVEKQILNLDIQIGLNLINVFFYYIQNSLKNGTIAYLENLDSQIWVNQLTE